MTNAGRFFAQVRSEKGKGINNINIYKSFHAISSSSLSQSLARADSEASSSSRLKAGRFLSLFQCLHKPKDFFQESIGYGFYFLSQKLTCIHSIAPFQCVIVSLLCQPGSLASSVNLHRSIVFNIIVWYPLKIPLVHAFNFL